MVAILWDMTPCYLVPTQQYVGGRLSFSLHDRTARSKEWSSPPPPFERVGRGRYLMYNIMTTCHGWLTEIQRNCTCCGVPRTYKTPSAISSGFK